MRTSDKEVDFYAVVLEAAIKRKSLYQGMALDKQKLSEFLEMNGWFGVDIHMGKRSGHFGNSVIFLEEKITRKLLKCLKLWLDAYNKSDSEKLEILAEYGRGILPITTSEYSAYIKESRLENDINSWKLLDFLLTMLPGELRGMDEGQVEILMCAIDQELSLVTAKLFVCFYEDMQKRDGANGWVYRFNTRSTKSENKAYSVKVFSRMAYCLFNEEYWEKQDLIGKACANEAFANLWAFLVMHFVCGLRATDIERIPKPELPCEGVTFREMLLKNKIKDTTQFAKEIQLRIRFKSYHPGKTLSYSHIPEIKLFIPISLEKEMGMILAIAASFQGEVGIGQPFIKTSRNITAIRKFLGTPFSEQLQGKNFSSRRANKSYLQGIEMIAGMDEADAPKGYMMAALARSHKGGIGTLPDITEIYLKDANFSGYTPEFIAREMFERGVFGFVPHILLETYAGREYLRLPVHEQTEIIKEIGISATKLEMFVRLNEKSYLSAKETVKSFVIGKGSIAAVLQRIAAGTASGKDEGSLCMMTACGRSCIRLDSRGCIGCKYEIYTKSVMHHIIKEYTRLKELCGEEDGWRYREIIRKTVLPMVGELLDTVKTLYVDADMKLLTKIMEGGMNGYDSCNESDEWNKLQQISTN